MANRARGQLVVEMTSDEARLFRGMQRIIGEQRKLEAGFGAAQRSGERFKRTSERAFSQRVLQSIRNYALGLVSVAGATRVATGAYQNFVESVRQGAQAAREGIRSAIAFAALQEGGTKRQAVLQAGAVAAEFGISDIDLAFNVIQGLQSRFAKFLPQREALVKGIAAARTVFAASQLGVPLEQARELEILGAALKQEPGQTLRRAFVAGQAVQRDPRLLSKAKTGLAFFEDQDFAFAAAGILAEQFGEEFDTFLKAAGVGLSKVSAKGFQRTFRKLGVEDATRMERLIALARAGIDTPEKLKEAGLTEIRQQAAISTLVKNIEEVLKVRDIILEQAKPGIFGEQRRAIEAELPQAKLDRLIAQQETGFKIAQSFDRLTLLKQAEEFLEKARGLALRRAGLAEGPLFFPFVDAEGRMTPFRRFLFNQLFLARLAFERVIHPQTPITELPGFKEVSKAQDEFTTIMLRAGLPPNPTPEQIVDILLRQAQSAENLQKATESLRKVTERLERATSDLPAMGTPNSDQGIPAVSPRPENE